MIVVDPDGSLPKSRASAIALAETLGAERLVGPDATRDAVLTKWSGRRLVHFAGHAELFGDDPWSTRLVVADGHTIDLDDVLTQRPELGLAVLEGCATGPVGRGAGLPHALLLSGTHAVIATTRPLGDGEGAAFLGRFYASGALTEPGRAFQRAVAASISAGDDAWRVFRYWGSPRL